ncbi:MAG: S-formylglutathione hydrolase [Betaproteobacteria bacterium]|nr:S-formylglutathione hydrolase [Betaproteobacteria bacterium]
MPASELRLLSAHACFGGVQSFHAHASQACAGEMRFSVYLPPQASHHPVPVLTYLAGLTCTEETFMIKAGAQQWAAEHGVMLVAPDTSPRNTGIADEAKDWDFGAGAGFYVDATQAPWSAHYRMFSYVTEELPALLAQHFPGDFARAGIFGHSMGGHGALVCALRNRGQYKSVSAFAPIAAPTQCAWGEKGFSGYLGADRAAWAAYDASELMKKAHTPFPGGILVDQGESDKFLSDGQLHPELFEAACAAAHQPLELRRHAGYDHGYYFISSFMRDHIAFHARQLGAQAS